MPGSWSKRTPKLVSERRALYSRCGAGAFLQPNPRNPGKSKYPIMAKSGPCVVDCQGARAAKSRAAQQHRRKLVKKADAKARKKACAWVR